jgi:LuxR family maltose regulon positive regulatory protein
VNSYVLLVDLHHALGDVEAALGYLHELKRISLTPGLSLPNIPLAAQTAERSLLLSRSRPDLTDLFAEAVRWAETSGLRPDDQFRYEQEYEYRTLARVLIAQGRAEEAIPLLERLIASAEGGGRRGQLIAYSSLQAIAHQAGNKMDAALTYLSRALALGEVEGYVRTFVDEGEPMAALLRQALARGIAVDYVGMLLAALEDGMKDEKLALSPVLSAAERLPKGRKTKPPPSSSLVEPLSDREVQILRCMAGRLSNREIADELHLSVNTVKWYARNIYSKLGVGKRREAVDRARELGVL